MSNLFTNLKKNIIKNITPFELALKTHASVFIKTFLNSDVDSEESQNSSDIESEPSQNTFSSHSGSDADDEHEVNTDVITKQNLNVPVQQTFDEDVCNLETSIYSPVNSSNDNNIEQQSPITSTINNYDLDNLQKEEENNTNIPADIFNDYLLINNLSILSHIEKYQKLSVIYDNTNNKLNFQIQIDDSYFPQLSRWYYNQSRTNTILTIDNLIDYSLQQYVYYNSTNNVKYIKKYNTLLNNAKKGLLNLKITYESDIENSLKISKIIEKITNL